MPASTLNAPIVSSSADGLAAHFTFDATTAAFGPIAHVQGGAEPAYDQTASVARLDHTLNLTPGVRSTRA